jgi:hypothetical protein
MGLGRKLVRKATPRPVRHAMHPVRTVKHKATPRPIRQLSRGVYTVTNPLGAAESAIIFGSGRRRSTTTRTQQTITRQTWTSPGVRAAEGYSVHDELCSLLAVQRERFAPITKPVPDPPTSVDRQAIAQEEWVGRKKDAPVWKVSKRKALKVEAEAAAIIRSDAEANEATKDFERRQEEIDRWWDALNRGDPDITKATLRAAFSDNPAPVVIFQAGGTEALLCMAVPWPDVLPDKKGHVTPTGRVSSKAWTKTEVNQVYADLIGGHLLATIRESWATAPALQLIRLFGIRQRGETPSEILFDVEVSKSNDNWNDDNIGTSILSRSKWGLHRVGQAHEVRGWPSGEVQPDLVALVDDI